MQRCAHPREYHTISNMPVCYSATYYGCVLCCVMLQCTNHTALRVLCCAMLCYAVLCCAVLCCAVLCCAVLCCAESILPIPLSTIMSPPSHTATQSLTVLRLEGNKLQADLAAVEDDKDALLQVLSARWEREEAWRKHKEAYPDGIVDGTGARLC